MHFQNCKIYLIPKVDSSAFYSTAPLLKNKVRKLSHRLLTHFILHSQFPNEIRRIIYTTNAVEGYHRMVRKFTKTKSIFLTDDSIWKTIYLSTKEIAKKWTMPVRDWGLAYAQFAIFFEDRFAA